jgi:hypothetical protein
LTREINSLGYSKFIQKGGIEMANRIVMWDEDTAADGYADFVDELNDAMAAVFDARRCPRVTVVDTGSDMFGVVVSTGHIADATAQKVWDDAMVEVGR